MIIKLLKMTNNLLINRVSNQMNEINPIINEKIKNRDFWMPFASSVLDKYSKKYFELNGHIENYKYMTSCVNTKPKYIEKLNFLHLSYVN